MTSALIANLATSSFEPHSPIAKRVLLIDRDPTLLSVLRGILAQEEYEVNVVPDVTAAVETLQEQSASVVILELNEAQSFNRVHCEQIVRAAPDTPIMILTAKPDLSEKVLLLDLGADDYVGVPFSPMELVARVRALIRRKSGANARTFYSFGEFMVNFLSLEVFRNGRRVVLTNKEFHVLKYMIKNANRAISRGELLNEVWGFYSYPCTRTVDNHILKLRQKLEPDPANPAQFLTVHGIGYRFASDGCDAGILR
jgi:DNA-binding response OmpR family regulator